MGAVIHSSLNRYLPWTTVLPSLGVTSGPVAGALPAHVQCPACLASRMTVFRDEILGGQWYVCESCGFAGDAAELAAAAWKCSPVVAVQRLIARGAAEVPPECRGSEATNRYVAQHIDARRRARDFWRSCQVPDLPDDNEDFTRLKRRFGMGPTPGSIWLERGGQYIGCCDRRAAEAFFQPGGAAGRTRSDGVRGPATGGHRLFPGPFWGPVLVIPFWDLPGRLRGFLFVGRQGGTADFIYRRVMHQAKPCVGTEPGWATESGLAMFPALAAAGGDLAGTALILTDVELAVRLQLRHLTEHRRPLPIVAGWEGPGYTSRLVPTVLPGLRRVHWGAMDDLRVLLQARPNGQVAANRPAKSTDLAEYTRHLSSASLVRRCLRKAEPWEAALERELSVIAPAATEQRVRSLELAPADLRRFLAVCPRPLRDRLAPLADDVSCDRVVRIGGTMVREQGHTWRTTGGELIADMVLRIDRVLYDAARGRRTYEGRVLFRGADFPFTAPGDIVDADPFAFMRDWLLAQKAGVATFLPAWSGRAVALAQQLHEPAFAAAISSIGWSVERSEFVFPGFILGLGGTIRPAEGVVLAGPAPCTAFESPAGLDAAVLSELAGVTEFWAVLAAVTAAAIEPALGSPAGGFLLVGEAARSVGRAAALACGCLLVPFQLNNQVTNVVARATALLQAHAWPVLLERPFAGAGADLPSPLLRALPPRVIIPATPIQAAALRLGGPWHVIERQGDPAGVAAILVAGHRAVPVFLAYLARRQLRLEPTAGTLLGGVLAALGEFLAEVGIDPGDLGGMVRVAGTPSWDQEWGGLVARVVDAGQLREVRELGAGPIVKGRHPALVYRQDGGVFIPSVGLNRVLRHLGAPGIDLEQATRRLYEAGILLSAEEHEGIPGWTVPETWWGPLLRRHRALTTFRLRRIS